MRTETITIYQYAELPTEDAKRRAREWWCFVERDDPSGYREHFESGNKAMVRFIQCETKKDLKQLAKDSKECNLTGYCADALFYELYKNLQKFKMTQRDIYNYYTKKWDEELNSRLSDREYIENSIKMNEYEFTADGERY